MGFNSGFKGLIHTSYLISVVGYYLFLFGVKTEEDQLHVLSL